MATDLKSVPAKRLCMVVTLENLDKSEQANLIADRCTASSELMCCPAAEGISCSWRIFQMRSHKRIVRLSLIILAALRKVSTCVVGLVSL